MNCCTAPVIFAAIGRRLGYPIKLVKTREHLFCRWDSPDGERFNIEATNQGYYRKSDAYYHTWPLPIPIEAVRRGVFLRSLTPRQELALFLCERGQCFMDNLVPTEAVKAFSHACKTDDNEPFLRNSWMIATMMCGAEREGWRMPVPREAWEKSIYPAACRELDRIRSNRQLKQDFFLRGVVSQEIAASF